MTNVESSSARVKRDTRLGEGGEPGLGHPITDLDTRRRHNDEERDNYRKHAGLNWRANEA